jgi:uncharacterized protein YlzI (FlbEa/FlbD family)
MIKLTYRISNTSCFVRGSHVIALSQYPDFTEVVCTDKVTFRVKESMENVIDKLKYVGAD